MEKLIIYLDQNFISNISKTGTTELNQKLKKVFDLIKEGVNEEKFVVPDSFIQHIETAKISNNLELIDSIYKHLKYLGQVTLLQPWEIEDKQFIKALAKYYNKEITPGEPWRDAFEDDPDKKMEKFDITVRIPDLSIDFGTRNKLQEIRDTQPDYLAQRLKEIDAVRREYKGKLKTDYLYTLKSLGLTIEEGEKFIDSDDFVQIPYIDIHTKLWAKNISKDGKKEIGDGDFNDIQMISAYLPYCDLLATEKYMKSLIESLGLNTKYKCLIYSMSPKQLDELIIFLKSERITRKSINTSLFSVVCYTNDGGGNFSPETLHKLVEARNKFERSQKNKKIHTGIYLVDKKIVEMPNKEEILRDGISALNLEQREEMYIFFNDIEEINSENNETLDTTLKRLQPLSCEKGLAIIENNFFVGKEMINTNDLFEDIENAIDKNVEITEKYKIKIVYH